MSSGISLKAFFSIICCWFFALTGMATNNDSLQKSERENDPVFKTANIFFKLAIQNIHKNPDKSVFYARKALALYQQTTETKSLTTCYYIMGTGYKDIGAYDSSLHYFNTCLTLRTQLKDEPFRMAEVKNGIGMVYSLQGNVDMALEKFMETQNIYDNSGDSVFISKGYNNLANVYYSNNQSDLALYYFKKSLAIKERLNIDQESTNTTRINLAVVYIDKKQFEIAKNYLNTALKYAIEIDNRPDLALIYEKYGLLYGETDNYPLALSFHEKAMKIREELDDIYGVTESLLELGRMHSKMNDFNTAISNYKKALAYAQETGTMEQLSELNDLISGAYKQLGDYKNAYNYLYDHLRYYDSIENQNSTEIIQQLQQKYEVKAKEKNIEELNIAKSKQEIEIYKKKTQINYISGISAFLILLILLLYYRYSLKQKNLRIRKEMAINNERMQIIEEKRILQEKQQKELLNVFINAQEEERKKIALDIHDGLGQILSGVKLNLQLTMDDQSVSEETKKILRNIQELSNESITESKNIASSLLPYNIKDYGLVTAIKNLCYNNNQLKISAISFYSNDVPRKLPEGLEISIYRITQELINNALKHAKAREIFVQLFYRDQKIILQVEDDGIGFDQSENKKNSMGLKNIYNRVNLLEGHLEIDSVVNKGTTTVAEFPLSS